MTPRAFAFPQFDGDPLCAEVDPELFFPEGTGKSPRPAIRICNRCEVESQCLQWSFDNGEQFGVWGGMSETQRLRIRRRGSAA